MMGMENSKKQRPSAGKGELARKAREERSAQSLRDNLRRRKMQARERDDEAPVSNSSSGDSAVAAGGSGNSQDDT